MGNNQREAARKSVDLGFRHLVLVLIQTSSFGSSLTIFLFVMQ